MRRVGNGEGCVGGIGTGEGGGGGAWEGVERERTDKVGTREGGRRGLGGSGEREDW